ncbi:PQQ-dependent sugar dehydrogenase, partial [Zobellia sp.]|nr:PQQ-dependent sugar dehydrogenase [Zobellia sp.]
MRNSVLVIAFTTLIFNNSCAQNTENKIDTAKNIPFTTELLIDEMQVPWGMVFLSDNELLITKKSGELLHFKNGSRTSVKNVPEVYTRGQGGLLDIELHPDYENTGWIYLSYALE